MEEELDIPFGAKDSELIEEFITIPDGFYATIEGNRVILRKHKEQESEELEIVATKYGRENTILPDYYNDGDIPNYERWTADAFKAGAEWQKAQDQQTIELAEEHALLAGMIQERERMIKSAFEGRLSSTISGSEQYVSAYVGYGEYGKDGDKVKVIIIKN